MHARQRGMDQGQMKHRAICGVDLPRRRIFDKEKNEMHPLDLTGIVILLIVIALFACAWILV